MTEEALDTIRPYLDAANVDLKSFKEKFYKEVCGAKLKPILENLERMRQMGIWVEITTLVIPTLNDSDQEFEEIARFIVSLGPEVPWHISAFYPTYKMLNLPRTAALALHRAREIGIKAGLRYVYCGNIPGEEGEDTFCPHCGRRLIERIGFRVTQNDVVNVDLKSFKEKFYKEVCGAKLKPILENLKRMRQMGVWVEITTLVIPTLNDSDQEFEEIAQFILSMGPEVPWHISAFYPTYKMLNLPRTPASTLHRAREIGIKTGLRYVYCGNVPGEEGEDTFCPHCGRRLIERTGFRVNKNDVVNGACRHCRGKLDGIWS